MTTFQYHPDILARYPVLRAGIVLTRGITNDPPSGKLNNEYLTEQGSTLSRIAGTALSEIEPLAAWRGAFRAFGVNPTKYRSAPEALLRRLTKKGDIPSINTLVDICNLVSIRYAIAVAAFDTSALQGEVTVRFADGSERYTPLGVSEVETPEPGEVIFADDSGLVIARRWCWRQSDESAARENTQNVIITVEAQHANCQSDVEAALADVLELLNAHVGGSFYDEFLGPGNPKISN